jgi:hypothetical protein
MSRIAFVISCLLVCLSGAARAGDDRAADALIAHGLELRREGKPDEALQMFQRAHALAPSARTLGQMGIVEGTLEHWTDAEEHLKAALAASEDPWVRKNDALLRTALESVGGHIGQISFSGPAGATITVAGRLAGTLPNMAPVRVAAGTVLVSASAAGTKEFTESVNVQAGMQTPVIVNLEPIELRPSQVAADRSPATALFVEARPRHTWRTWTGAGLITAGAGLLTWGIVWIAVDGRGSGGTCTVTATPCSPVYNTKTPGWILTAGGAVAAAAGGVVLYSGRSNNSDVNVSLAPGELVAGGRF